MRTLLLVSAIVAFATVPAFAIMVDGDISDWPSGDQLSGPLVNVGTGTFRLAKYGAVIDSGTLYAFVQVKDALTGNKYPGMYIDVDRNEATTVGNLSGYVPPGVDICVEVDYDNGALPPLTGWTEDGGGGPAGHAVNFWGHANNWKHGAAGSTGVDAHNTANTVFEWSVPLSEIVAEVANTNGVTPLSADQWKIYVGGEAAPTYGREVGLVPEPGSLAMVLGAGLALLGYALRRRS